MGNVQVSLPQCVYILKWSREWPVLCVYLFYTLDFVQP